MNCRNRIRSRLPAPGRFAFMACTVLLGQLIAGLGFSAENGWVTVVPKTTNQILANPGMGWQTFHHTAAEDKSLPDWIPSTVHYVRWGWGTLEPQPGSLDSQFLDEVLQQTREAGQKLAFRVMCCSSTPRNPYHPAWLQEIGGRILRTQYGSGPVLEVPDLDDPKILAAHLDFIRRLGARYDGHPDLDHVDLGSVGWWGEWHMSESRGAPMPTAETQKRIVDAYLSAFRHTPLVMLIGGGPMLRYAVEQGTGWRADCLGDMGGFSQSWCHMRNAYPVELPQANAVDAWQTAPVAWETCWDMRKWVESGWPLRYIFNYALALHGSQINNKSAPLPAGQEVQAELRRFLQRLGYRLILKQLKHPRRVRAGQRLSVQMAWQNVGSAPCYRPYHVAYCLSDAQGTDHVFVSQITVERWLPGSVPLFTPEFLRDPPDLPAGEIVQADDQIQLPADLPSGDYRLAIGIVEPSTRQPVVQLGIEGRTESGWYPLSKITVE